jgi:SAM-dependent methyltransferase
MTAQLNQTSWIKKECLFCKDRCQATIKYKRNFSEDSLNSDIFSARRTTQRCHYQVMECQKTGLVYSSPILPFEKITKLYQDSKQNYDDLTKYISTAYIIHLRENQKLFKQKDSALDIGCGNGFFLRELQNFDFTHVYGIEPSEEAVEKSGDLKKYIFEGTFEQTEYPAENFDLITCFHTLDHLVNPLSALQKMARLLKPDGIGYFIVHNEKALQAKLLGEKSPIYDVEHVYLFNKETLTLACEKIGFQTIEVFNIKNYYPLRYWLDMINIPFKKIILKIINILGLADLKIGLKAGNIGIIVKKIND